MPLPLLLLGLTQLLKDAGVQGEWNKLTCSVLGLVAVSLVHFTPALWAFLGQVLLAPALAGNVSFLYCVIQKWATGEETEA